MMSLAFVLILMLPLDHSYADDPPKYEINHQVVITTHPQSKTVLAGEPATFDVVALSADSYQWQKNGVNIPGATLSTYKIESVKALDSGTYRVIVTSDVGSVTSDNAVLKIK